MCIKIQNSFIHNSSKLQKLFISKSKLGNYIYTMEDYQYVQRHQ